MGVIKLLIGLPLLVALLVFAFVNNDFVTINFWPFYLEMTVALSVVVVFFAAAGFLVGSFFAWLSYAPVRAALRDQKRQNKKLSKEQEKLVKEVEGLHENIAVLKEHEPPAPPTSLAQKMKNMFGSKKEPAPQPQDTQNFIN